MIKFQVEFKGKQQLEKAMISVDPMARRAALEGLTKAALMVHADAVKNVQSLSSGKRVTRYNPKRSHVTSRPGDPPNTDTGNLVRNIQYNVDEKRLIASVGTNVVYGRHLELARSKRKRRPWLKPAADKNRKRIAALFKFKGNK